MSTGDLEPAAKNLAERCLAKFDDSAASPDVRAFSLSILLSQISHGNRAMMAYVPEICQCLKDCSDLMRPDAAGCVASDFHRQVIDAVTVIFDSSRIECIVGGLDTLLPYLVQLVGCQDIETASLACQFWARHSNRTSTALIASVMPDLVTALMDRMIFREHFELSSFQLLCQRAASALESVIETCAPELTLETFRPLLEMRIESDSWMEKEAAIRALGAFTIAARQYHATIAKSTLPISYGQ